MGEILKRYKGDKFLGYYLRFYENGRRRILASKQATHAEARRMLIEIEARIVRGEVGIVERRPELQLDELCERFLSEYSRPAIKDVDRYRAFGKVALDRIVPLLSKPADQVTSLDVAKAREALRRNYAPASVRLSLSFLSTLFTWAMRENLVAQNPCRGVERPRPESSVDYLSSDEAQRLIRAAAAQAGNSTRRMLHLAIALALHTGMRKGELLGLRWTDIDLATRRLTVARSYDRAPKSNKPRHLRLPAALTPLFAAWRSECPRTPENVVFPIGKFKNTVAGERAMLGLPRLWQELGLRPVDHVWHCLRHTFASHFIMSGGNILTLQKILGHADLKHTLIYAHLAPDFLDGEFERVKFF